MPAAFFTFKLKPGVSRADYEKWVVDFDYPHVAQIPSIISQRVSAATEVVFGSPPPPFDYLEVLEFTNVTDYLNDLQNHPAAQAIAAQLPNFVEILGNARGHFIPPGVNK